jgi:hypothetical protein
MMIVKSNWPSLVLYALSAAVAAHSVFDFFDWNQALGRGQIMGSGFSTESYEESSFGFVVSYPREVVPEVVQASCVVAALCKTVGFARQDHRSGDPEASLSLEFSSASFSGAALNRNSDADLDTLRALLQERFPGRSWSEVDPQAYAKGLESKETRQGQTHIIRAYAPASQNVVLVQVKYRQNSAEAALYPSIVSSIRRVGTPPRLLAMKPEHPFVRRGGQSCWVLDVDDVRGYLFAGSLSRFELMGESPKNPQKHVGLVQGKRELTLHRFRLCHQITEAFATANLVPRALTLDSFGENDLQCESVVDRAAPGSFLLRCQPENSESLAMVAVQELRVEAPKLMALPGGGDRSSPVVAGAALDASGVLVLDARDQTRIESVQIVLNGERRIIHIVPPSQQEEGTIRIDLREYSEVGLVVVDALVVADTHGWASVFNLSETGSYIETRVDGSEDGSSREVPREDIKKLSYWWIGRKYP